MTKALNINSFTDKNQKIQEVIHGNIHRNQVNQTAGDYKNLNINSNSANKKISRPFDYSAIKLNDDDKLYRLKVKKQSDALLSAAETITTRFPPLFNQMITSYNSTQGDIMERIEKSKDINENNDNSENVENNKNIENNENVENNKNIENNENVDKLNDKLTNASQTLDVEGISSKIADFVRSFNEMHDTAKESKSYTAQSTVNRLNSIFEDSKEALSQIGITEDKESNNLKIDRNKLMESVKDGSAEEILTAKNGFTDKSAKIAFESAENSDKFIDKAKTSTNSRPQRNTNINYNYFSNPSIDN